MESTNITHTSFEDTCRVCLAKNGALVDIFRCHNRNIPEEIHYCSGVLVNVSDNLPPNICVACLKELSVACKFKQKCLKADEVFRQVLVVEQVEYLEDYFQVTEQEHGSTIYVADIDKENTEIISSSDNIENISQTNNQNINNRFQNNNIENTEQSSLERTKKVKEHFQKLTEQTSNLERTKIENGYYKKFTEQMSILQGTKIDKEHGVKNFEGRLDTDKTKFTTKTNCDVKYNVHHCKKIKKNHLCELCGEQFSTHVSYLTHHMREHKKHKLPQYHCDQCGFITDNKYRLSTHMKQHSAVFKYICNYCNRQLLSKNVLMYHIWQHIHEEKKLKCSECHKIFGNISDLEEHQNVHSEDKRIYACDKCPAKYCNVSNYWCHMSVKHRGQSKGKKLVTSKYKPNVKIEYEVINSTDDLINKLIGEINSQDNTEEFHDTVDDYIHLDNLTDNENSDDTKRNFENLNSEQNSTLNTLENETSIEYVEVRDDESLNTKEPTEKNSTTMLKEIKIVLQDVLARDKTPERKEIPEQDSPLRTVQKRNVELQDVENLEGRFNVDKTKDVPSKSGVKYPCNFCLRQFSSHINLKNHISVIHLNTEKSYTCSSCNKKFLKKGYLTKHLKVHLLDGPSLRPAINRLIVKEAKIEPKTSKSTQKISNREVSTEQTSTLKTVQNKTIEIQYVVNIDRIRKIPSESTPKISKSAEINEQTSTLKTKQNITPIETQDVMKIDLTEDIPSKRKPTKSKRSKITEQTSTLDIVQKRTKNEKRDVKNLEGRLKPFTCEVCGKQLSNRDSHRMHLRLHDSNVQQYHCDLCGFKTLHKGYLSHHMYVHTGGRPNVKNKVRNCLKCNLTFNGINAYNRHRRNVHVKPITCEICGMQLSSRDSYRKHLLLHDANVPQYRCDLCGFKTLHKDCLRKHMFVHTGGRPSVKNKVRKCLQCDLSFNGINAYHRHRRNVHVKPVTCEICGMQLSSRDSYRKHLLLHDANVPQYHCDLCGFKTLHKSCLRKHMFVHTGGRPSVKNKVIKCLKCDLSFNGINAYNRHNRNVHVKPVTCEICDMLLSDRNSYGKHLRTHYAPKYSCNLCDHKSGRKRDLKQHKLQHHSNSQQYHCDIKLTKENI